MKKEVRSKIWFYLKKYKYIILFLIGIFIWYLEGMLDNQSPVLASLISPLTIIQYSIPKLLAFLLGNKFPIFELPLFKTVLYLLLCGFSFPLVTYSLLTHNGKFRNKVLWGIVSMFIITLIVRAFITFNFTSTLVSYPGITLGKGNQPMYIGWISVAISALLILAILLKKDFFNILKKSLAKYLITLLEMMLVLFIGIIFFTTKKGEGVILNDVIWHKAYFIIIGFVLFLVLEIIRNKYSSEH